MHLIAELARASNTDRLTGLLDRCAFDADLEAQVQRALRSGAPPSPRMRPPRGCGPRP
jgi:GGDEF domain-containing protein